MTDVAPKTPNKRKSFGGKQGSPKKTKLENGQTPQQLGSAKKQQNKQTPQLQKTQDTPKPQKNQQTPKQKHQQTPKLQKNQGTPNPQKNLKQNQGTPNLNKSNKKAKKGAGETKAAPFKGTSQIQVPKLNVKKEENESTNPAEVKVKKVRRDGFVVLLGKIKSTDDNVKLAAVAEIEAKIKTIESRGELTKTANRKLKKLNRFKRIAQGIPPVAQVKTPNAKSVSTKRRERRNKSKTETVDVKVEKGAKKVPVIKQEKKKVVQVTEEPEDSDDSEEEELSIGKLVKQEAASDDEDDSGEEEEDSGEEEEDDDDDEDSEESD